MSKFDPKNFISPPFILCPKCAHETFGILDVYGQAYRKRCTECFHTSALQDLPYISKKIIYLDQFFLGSIFHLRNLTTGKARKIDPFYKEAGQKLDLLMHAQVILCPYSEAHVLESAIAYDYASGLESTYRGFAKSVQFASFSEIEKEQIYSAFREWLDSKKSPTPPAKLNALRGGNPFWESNMYIEIKYPWKAEYTESIRKNRESAYLEISNIFSRWKQEQSKQFEDWFEEEAKSAGTHYLKAIQVTLLELNNHHITYPFRDEYRTFLALEQAAFGKNIPKEKVTDFFESDFFKNIPFVEIESAIWGKIAHDAAHGNKNNPPNKGMGIDVSIVSRYLPYCDVMFLDKETTNNLSFPKIQKKVKKYNCEVFSLKTQKQFLSFLDKLILEINEEHLAILRTLYGQEVVDEILDAQSKIKR